VHKNGQWVNEIEERATLSSQVIDNAAVTAARDEAKPRKTEHVIHNLDGTIAERNS
jgi:hypothetical protein